MSHLEHILSLPLVVMLGDSGKLTDLRTMRMIRREGVFPSHIAMIRIINGKRTVFLTEPYSQRFNHVIIPNGKLYQITLKNKLTKPNRKMRKVRDGFWGEVNDLMLT